MRCLVRSGGLGDGSKGQGPGQPGRVRLLAARSGAIALAARDLPQAWPEPARCIVLPLPVAPGDWRLRPKTTDRGLYQDAQRVAHSHGAQEPPLIHN